MTVTIREESPQDAPSIAERLAENAEHRAALRTLVHSAASTDSVVRRQAYHSPPDALFAWYRGPLARTLSVEAGEAPIELRDRAR